MHAATLCRYQEQDLQNLGEVHLVQSELSRSLQNMAHTVSICSSLIDEQDSLDLLWTDVRHGESVQRYQSEASCVSSGTVWRTVHADHP